MQNENSSHARSATQVPMENTEVGLTARNARATNTNINTVSLQEVYERTVFIRDKYNRAHRRKGYGG